MNIKIISTIFLVLCLVGVVSAAPSYTFRQNDDVNFRFRCFDENNSYCSSDTVLLISIENPDGTNVVNNGSMTHNETFFNHSLPTSQLGIYPAIIVSPTTNGTISEFTYEVTPSGFTGTIAFYFLILILSLGVIILGFAIKDAWITILGTFGLYFVGIYILFNGIAGLKDATTTWAIGLIILAIAGYISIRSGIEVLEG